MTTADSPKMLRREDVENFMDRGEQDKFEKLFISPREFNFAASQGYIKTKYYINVDISEEKDKLINQLKTAHEKIRELECKLNNQEQ